MKIFSINCFLIFIFNSALAQKENNIWYFGNNAGIDFNSGVPVAIHNGALSTHEGCASICDSAGSLLFYTDGVTVYNKNHQMMMNGDSLNGHASSAQSALILKKPGDSYIYYIFTTGVPYQTPNIGLFCYSIVNLTMDNGNGAITVKNFMLDSMSAEKLTATMHSNNKDYWITMHEVGYSTSNQNNIYKSFLLTSNGVSAPVSSTSGGPIYGSLDAACYLRFSPNGNKIADIHSDFHQIILSDFDRSTGIISNPILITLNYNLTGMYGVEFSPNGRFLYSAVLNFDTIYQWDISSNIATIINASKYLIVGTYIPINSNGFTALQRGPDGKIYIGEYLTPYLAVINNPDLPGQLCHFQDSAVYLGNGICRLGLPNCIYTDQLTANVIEVKTEPGISYPNPSNGKILFKNTIDEIIIYDVNGKTMLQNNHLTTGNELNISELSSGIYFCRYFCNSHVQMMKFVVN